MTDVTEHGQSAVAIAAMADDDINQFMRDGVRNRSLHHTVRRLNADALSTNAGRRQQARHALGRMGFVD